MNNIIEQLKLNLDLREKRSTIDMAQKRLADLKARKAESSYEDNAHSKIKTNLVALISALESGDLPDDETTIYDIKGQLFRI